MKPLRPWIRLAPSVFDPSSYRGCRKRVRDPILGVSHWTAGEAGPAPEKQVERVIKVLRARKNLLGFPSPLSIHFVIDSSGVAWQCADPETTIALHAGEVNDDSIGTEIVSGGLPSSEASYRPRERVTLKLRGRPVEQLAFTQPQLETYADLCEVLATEFGIPRRVPGAPPRTPRGRLVSDRVEICDRQLTKAELARFAGFLEHLHVHKDKPDAGTQPSRFLAAARGFAVFDVERGAPRTTFGL